MQQECVNTVHHDDDVVLQFLFTPLPTIGNSLKKQKSLYKVLLPSIKPPI